MSKALDLTGQKFGRLTAVRRVENVGKRAMWLCVCDCKDKNEVIVSTTHLRSGHTKSCGCYSRDLRTNKFEDLTGKKFGRWTVLEKSEERTNTNEIKWKCQCSCENKAIKNIVTHSLKSGNSKSCGCLARELASARTKGKYQEKKIEDLTGKRFGFLTVEKMANRNGKERIRWICRCDCGESIVLTRNSLKKRKELHCGCMEKESYQKKYPRLQKIWASMKQRCGNPNNDRYADYGGRGIDVCEEWSNFVPFAKWALSNGYKKGLTIDRKDNDKGYYPDNCQWITAFEQMSNTRRNVYITYRDETHTVSEWARITGININTLYYRLNEHWELDEVFEAKPHKRHERRENKNY